MAIRDRLPSDPLALRQATVVGEVAARVAKLEDTAAAAAVVADSAAVAASAAAVQAAAAVGAVAAVGAAGAAEGVGAEVV